jgi:dihydroorotate dehydrogenase (NAD+) catalytic subunit
MIDLQTLPRYDRTQSYQWNYEHAPEPVECDVPVVPGDWNFCGFPVESPLGMPAGPLLNGRWILYYASLGFDVLTYKTTRSVHRDCYSLPNLLPVESGQLTGGEKDLPAAEKMQGSWAVSFGMPSASPDLWRADVEWTRKRLPEGKVLSVSVVGSVQEGWSIDDLADDYAQCARWAVESGADCVETNFSCPNVSTCDGQLFQQPAAALAVAARVREAIGNVPYLIKAGHINVEEEAVELLDAVAPYVNSVAMTNSVATTIRSETGELYFDGQQRGICGEATRSASIAQTRMFSRLIAERGLDIRIVGVGGASTVEHVRDYLAAGAESVHIATAAMTDPAVALQIRRHL